MNYKEALLKGFDYLVHSQNPDGGIGGDARNDKSSPMTTGLCLDLCASSPYFPAKFASHLFGMARYLVKTQFKDGGWHVEGETPVLTSAFALTGLLNARQVVWADDTLRQDISSAITRGVSWLTAQQNRGDGGWSTEALASSASRITTTCYPAEVYILLEQGRADPRVLQRAIDFMLRNENESGGWGRTRGEPSDIGSTARVIETLLKSGQFDRQSPVIQRGVRFLLRHRDSGPVWSIYNERFQLQTNFWANNPCDASRSLVRAGIRSRDVKACLSWILSKQNPTDGHWVLQDDDPHNTIAEITTWTTRDALTTLSLAGDVGLLALLESETVNTRIKVWPLLAILLLGVVTVETVVLSGLDTLVATWWLGLPDDLRNNIIHITIGVILLGIITRALGNLVAKYVDKLLLSLRGLLQRFFHWVFGRH